MTEVPAGTIASPNIWEHPDTYELENRGVDPDGVIWSAIESLRPVEDARVLDIGCGAGFHLPWFAARGARTVTGVEPHQPLIDRAEQRLHDLDPAAAQRISVLKGSAARLPLPDRSVDLAHARWAYFFGPGCEPGLAELDRVMAPSGVAVVIDHDPRRSTFGAWFTEAWPDLDHESVTRFWTRRGWSRIELDSCWRQPDRASFEAVVRIEFTAQQADRILAAHPGREVDYAVSLWHRSW